MRQFLMACLAIVLGVATSATAQEYTIQPGDMLEITVLEDPGLNRQVLVRPDGKISLPLAGTLDAAGRTPEALQAAVRGRLGRDFVQPPTVTVSLVSLGDQTPMADDLASIYIVGAINAPGRYDVELPMDILQALALSGGPGVFAARQRIQVRRRSQDRDSVFLFDFDAVESGETPVEPITLQDGDVIVVPERGLFE